MDTYESLVCYGELLSSNYNYEKISSNCMSSFINDLNVRKVSKDYLGLQLTIIKNEFKRGNDQIIELVNILRFMDRVKIYPNELSFGVNEILLMLGLFKPLNEIDNIFYSGGDVGRIVDEVFLKIDTFNIPWHLLNINVKRLEAYKTNDEIRKQYLKNLIAVEKIIALKQEKLRYGNLHEVNKMIDGLYREVVSKGESYLGVDVEYLSLLRTKFKGEIMRV